MFVDGVGNDTSMEQILSDTTYVDAQLSPHKGLAQENSKIEDNEDKIEGAQQIYKNDTQRTSTRNKLK